MDFGEECEQLICTLAHCRKVYPEACSENLIKTKRLQLNFLKDAEFKINKKDNLQETTSMSSVDLEKCMSDAMKIGDTSEDLCKKLDEVTDSLKNISEILKMMDKQADIQRPLRKRLFEVNT